MALKPFLLKKHATLNEMWVQDQIAKDPSLLGLGDLILKDKERIQPSGGRLDILLQDPETFKRYEVELQLGAIDESHIIRTLEYWDTERKRYPQYDHVAVIIAEDITSRFLNVIQLFNGAIPLIAMKMTAYEVNGDYHLTFVKVLDEVRYGFVDDDEPITESADREYWEKKGSKKSLAIADKVFELVMQVETTAAMKYNRHYIGILVNGSPFNFITFNPQKNTLVINIRLPKTTENDALIEETGLESLPYTVWGRYRLRIEPEISDKQREIILSFIKRSRESYKNYD